MTMRDTVYCIHITLVECPFFFLKRSNNRLILDMTHLYDMTIG